MMVMTTNISRSVKPASRASTNNSSLGRDEVRKGVFVNFHSVLAMQPSLAGFYGSAYGSTKLMSNVLGHCLGLGLSRESRLFITGDRTQSRQQRLQHQRREER